MKIQISDSQKAAKFTAIFQHLKQFTDNVNLYFRETGLYIQCLDDSHCCIFECELHPDWFAEYTFHEATHIGLNLAMFHKVLHTRHESQTILLELPTSTLEKQDKFEVSLLNGSQGKFNKYFELHLVLLEAELMDIKPSVTIVDLTLETKTLCDLVNQFMIFNDELTLTFDEEAIVLAAAGAEGTMKAHIKLDDVKEYAISENTVLTQAYSLRYIHLMCQFSKLNPDIYLGFSQTMPLQIKYDLGGNSHASFYLAPKIGDLDDY